VDASALASVPHSIGPWRSVDIPLEDTVESMLRADFNLQRVYMHPLGDRIEVYVGYYGTERGGRPEHTPWACYPSGGWKILDSRRVWIDRAGGLRANEMEVEQGGERHLVQFWYRSHRRTGMTGTLDQALDRFAALLGDGRTDGALVRVSTKMEAGDLVGARSRLMGFGAQLDQLLAERWPDEFERASRVAISDPR
jgi:EpsI family protein